MTTVPMRLLWPVSRALGPAAAGRGRLKKVGITMAMLTDPEARVPSALARRLLDEAAREFADPLLGLRAARLVEPGDVGIVEYAARAASTVGEALEILARRFALLDGEVELTLRVEDRVATLSYRRLDASRDCEPVVDFVVGALYGFIQRNALLGGGVVVPCFSRQAPRGAADYAALFGVAPSFDADFDGLTIPRALLDAPMRHPNPSLCRSFEERAARLLPGATHRGSMTSRVRLLVFGQLEQGPDSMEAMARRLGMSVATLRRSLAAEGTRFSDIVDQARRAKVEDELVHGTSLKEVAFMAGYSTHTAFHRAFRRWTGLSPGQFRARLGASEAVDEAPAESVEYAFVGVHTKVA